jgi:hypothetical protein
MLHLVLAKPSISSVHVVHDDSDMLEPEIVAPRVRWNGPSSRRQILGELDFLVSQPHADDAQARAEDSLKPLEVLAMNFALGRFLERSTRV